MEVSVESPQPCEAILTIVVDDQQMEQARERACKEFARYITVPGFRPGKAPRHLVEQAAGAEAIEKHARELVVQIAYKAAIEKEGIEPYDQGSVEDVDTDEDQPFTFKANVPLRPTVELGDTANLLARWNPVQVTPADVQREIDGMLNSRAKVEPIDEPAIDGDVVFADLSTTVDGEPIGGTRSATFQVGQNMPEIDAALRGAVSGDTRECDVAYPDDYADDKLAGKTVHFTLLANHILRRRAPELTDEWVKENSDVDSVEALRNGIQLQLEAISHRDAEEDVRGQLLGEIVLRSTINYPSRLVDREVAEDLRKLSADLESKGTNLDDYLQRSNLSIQQLQDQMAVGATRRIKNGLAMGKLAQVENLTLTPADVDAEIAAMASSRGMKPKDLKRRLKDEGALDNLEDRMLQERLFDFLKSRAEIDGYPSTAEPESE
ncbi:MAG TPA: trigger factor [Armatimonadota bacterium]|jgi:trigger factor